MTERGAVKNGGRAGQLRDFTGLRYETITPTDIDAVMEYHDECYVFIEAKCEGTEMERGQELCFERLCRDLNKVKPAIYVIGEHSTPVDEAIDFATMTVTKIWFKGRWLEPKFVRTVRETIDAYLEFLA